MQDFFGFPASQQALPGRMRTQMQRLYVADAAYLRRRIPKSRAFLV